MTRLDRLTERLNLKEFQLRALLDVTKAINNNLGHDELLQLYARIMRDDLGITRLMLFEHGDRWNCVQSFGATEGAAGRVRVAELMQRYRDIQFIGAGDHELAGFDIAVPVFHREQPLALLLIGDIDEAEQRMSPTVKHMNFIQTLTNLIAVAVENKRLARQALAQERDKRELELAAEMQMMLIPRDLPDDERVQAAAWYQPHRQVGGDYYDMIATGDDEFVVCVADVSGKGIAAALLMSNFQATLRAKVHTDTPLVQLVAELNANVLERARGERFITLFLGRVDLKKGTMQFVNAGHNAPLLLLRSGVLSELTSGCIALGMLPELPFVTEGRADITGATLLCYTDGLVEQEDSNGNAFETPPVRRTLELFQAAGPKAINDALISTFEAHRAGLPYLDDIALLTCRFS